MTRALAVSVLLLSVFGWMGCGGSLKGGGGGADLPGLGDVQGKEVLYGDAVGDAAQVPDDWGPDAGVGEDSWPGDGLEPDQASDPQPDPAPDPALDLLSDQTADQAADLASDPVPDPEPDSAADTGGVSEGTVGGCDPCGTGTLAGKTCAPNAKMAVPYVKVWIDTFDCNGNPVHIQTFSDEKGEYVLEDVPCGLQTIYMQKGSFGNTFQRFVDQNKVTVVSSGEGCFPGTAAKIAVITGDWDEIQKTLAKLHLAYKLIPGTTPGGTGTSGPTEPSQEAIDFLTDSAELNSYDVLFINCSDTSIPNMDQAGAEISANLKAFVAKGGSVYASDYGLPYLSRTWPGYILGGAWSAGGNTTYHAAVVDSDLAGYLGKSTVDIRYGLGPLTCVEGIGPETHLFIDSTQALSGCSGTQMMMSFAPEPGGGKVIYTTFHNDEQPDTVSDMQMILEYTVFLM